MMIVGNIELLPAMTIKKAPSDFLRSPQAVWAVNYRTTKIH